MTFVIRPATSADLQHLYEMAKLGSAIDKLQFAPSGILLVAITADGQVHIFEGGTR